LVGWLAGCLDGSLVSYAARDEHVAAPDTVAKLHVTCAQQL
jgi:hypothetical protein